MIPSYWDEAKAYLSKRDNRLKKIIASYHGDALTLRGDAFYTLARAIAGQQISVKAADSIWNKLMIQITPHPTPLPHAGEGSERNALAGEGKLTPERLLALKSETLRGCGFSGSKVVYLHSLASHFLENKKLIKKWPEMTDEEIIEELTGIKGIGRWTAEMFLIFGLGRPDVFPTDDLGLLKGIYRHYNRSGKMTLGEVRAVGDRWRPYRSMGTWYMWRVLDPLPVSY